ncbi:MAG: ATP-binding protein [Oscillospiraceae bacterium]|jgi:predicted AAA+ superfamily ATPase|nr:ATP-binding protein [Oscillospiraceae bacterium]
MKNRQSYLNTLLEFLDKEVIKVIVGVRRCGKSTLLKLFTAELKKRKIPAKNIIHINFESMKYRDITDYNLFYDYVSECIPENGKVYLLIDEPQNVTGWEKAVNSFKVDFDCDIYITGSNASLLSSELSTLIAGRYVEIDLYPLSYKEYLDFHGIEKNDKTFQNYLKLGGFPSIVELGENVDRINDVLDGIYNTVIVKDVIAKNKIKDEELLQKIVAFLADNVGNSTSSNSIANSLVSEKRIDNTKKAPAVSTVESYINALEKAFIFYEAKRYDVKGKTLLKTLGKYYIVDIGLRNMLLGYRDVDRGHILENIVYLELKRRGYNVFIGKVDEKEVDFIAEKASHKLYIQVSETLGETSTLERELAPFRAIKDNYEKIIITNDKTFVESYEGIKVKNTVDWLCE